MAQMTDISVVERALVVMAVCMGLQTVIFVAAAIAGFVAWRRTADALAEARTEARAQVAEFRAHLDHISGTVDEAARALLRGSSAVDDVITDMRDAVGSVKSSVGSVASVVTAPRAALALGLWRGIQVWRRRRAARRVEEAPVSDVEAKRFGKGDGHDEVERSGV